MLTVNAWDNSNRIVFRLLGYDGPARCVDAGCTVAAVIAERTVVPRALTETLMASAMAVRPRGMGAAVGAHAIGLARCCVWACSACVEGAQGKVACGAGITGANLG